MVGAISWLWRDRYRFADGDRSRTRDELPDRLGHHSTPEERQTRFTDSVKLVDDNWKVGLLILVPLFFRTIRSFLERVEEAWGMKAPRIPEVAESAPNPASEGDDLVGCP